MVSLLLHNLRHPGTNSCVPVQKKKEKNTHWSPARNFLYAAIRTAKKNYVLSSRNFLYAASSPAPYSAVFFVGT
jgi:hypothetical protein